MSGEHTLWWGGYCWDSFAVPHLLDAKPDVLIATRCPGCDRAGVWVVGRDASPDGDWLAHFLVPVAHMWDDVVHTCSNQRLCCSAGCIREWLARTHRQEGAVMDLATLWRLASRGTRDARLAATPAATPRRRPTTCAASASSAHSGERDPRTPCHGHTGYAYCVTMAVREGLMALLAEEPRYGYQLKTAFESATGGVWTLNVGQVYTTLDRLRRDGLVDVDATGEQKRYSLTPGGREALGDWWRAIPVEDPPPRDELQLKVLLAIDHGPDHAIAVITRQRTALTRLLQQHRRSLRTGDALPLAEALVADALAVRAEADLRWLDLCESRILRAGRAAAAKHNGGKQ